jgi:hypothetical protein
LFLAAARSLVSDRFGELGAKQEDLRRAAHPEHEHDQRAGRAIRRAWRRATEVDPISDFPRVKGTAVTNAPRTSSCHASLCGENLLDRCEQQREDGERNDGIERSEQDIARKHARKPVTQSQQAGTGGERKPSA